MTASPKASAQECIFCAIVAGQAPASVVHTDEVAVVFMDRNPITAGHLLIVPRVHTVGFEDLDVSTGRHLWSLGHRMARALRRSGLRWEGTNVFVADGEAASQEVFHFHVHVLPRYGGDGFSIGAPWRERSRGLLDADAQAIKGALARSPFTP